MPIFDNGEVAIVIFDTGNVITYDSLRLWKRVLEEEPNLGAAGQSVFLMTGLPSSYGFDMRSEVLNSNISVSLAMATGMAVGLTYLNLKANNNTISEDEDFFSPIAHRVVGFPVLPNITFYFGLNQKEFIMPYDYYFFGFSENVTRNDFNASRASFEEIFVLHSVLLWPRTSLATVARKVWPGEGSGPERDYCLQTPFDTNPGALITILFGIVLPAAFVLFIHIFYHT
ncbi:unnamed protein product [Dibothriocephalus latus]|uniref:Uncharacterized protein n=1 Tax=Dibothriocephalus latus TaxID=60516 RepID=A0A3P7LQ93_DIBLA|nr:unnamed protein product [Dibothriocephalus latus]